MKTRNKIFLICIIAILGFYVSVISLGPGSVFALFSPASILYFPSILMQLIANEGNGIICVDACGPCSAWGPHHLLVDGKCKIPDKAGDCYSISPPMEWEFVNNNCIPLSGVYNYNNTIPHDPEEFVNHNSPNIDYLILFETGESFSGQYMITNGTVQKISFVEDSRIFTMHLEQAGNGKIDLLADYGLFYPSNVEAEQGFDVYADGKKIDHVQRTLSLFEIPFDKDTKEITIVRKIPE